MVHLGLSDGDVMGCMEHGYGRSSVVSAAQACAAAVAPRANPVDTTFRVAAHMSGVDFERARTQRQLQQQQQQELQQQQLHQRDVEDRRSRAFWRVVGVGGGVAAAALCALLLVRRRWR